MRPYGLRDDLVLIKGWFDEEKGEKHIYVAEENKKRLLDMNITKGIAFPCDMDILDVSLAVAAFTDTLEEMKRLYGDALTRITLSFGVYKDAKTTPGSMFLLYKNEVLKRQDKRLHDLIIYIGPVTILGIPSSYEGKDVFEPAFEYCTVYLEEDKKAQYEKLGALLEEYPEISSITGKLDELKTRSVEVTLNHED